MSETKKENTSKKKEIWKKLRGFLVIVMVAVISIAGTLAYLSRKTNRVTNTFTATDDIKVELTEPEFTPPPGGYQPDVTYPKDPQLANVTGADDGSSEWVIMRVDYRTFTDSEPATADGKTTKTRTYTQVSYDDITHAQPLEGDALKGDAAKGLITVAQDLNSIVDSDNWIKVKPEWLDDDLATQVFGSGWARDNGTQELKKGNDAQKCDYFVYKKVVKSSSGTTTATIATNKTNLKSSDDSKKVAAQTFFGDSNESITTPLFSSVTIKSQEQLLKNGYTMDTLPGFTIDVIGGAIKNQGDEKVEIATGILDTANLKEKTVDEKTNTSRTIVNELVRLLVDEDFESNTEIITITKSETETETEP